MAIRLITGVPGAGKSYFAVTHIAKKYCDYIGDEFFLKEEFVLVTNIEGLKLDSIDLEQTIEDTPGGVKKFFTYPMQEKIYHKYKKEKKKIVYFIDEAQEYFDRKFYDREVFYFFEKHRHLGLDIYLLTQDRHRICKDIIGLMEFEWRAVPRTVAFGRFIYNKLIGRHMAGKKLLKKDKKVFNLYKSMEEGESEKMSHPLVPYFIGLACLIVFMGFTAKKSLGKYFNEGEEKNEMVTGIKRGADKQEKNKIESRADGAFSDRSTRRVVPVRYDVYDSGNLDIQKFEKRTLSYIVRYKANGKVSIVCEDPLHGGFHPLKDVAEKYKIEVATKAGNVKSIIALGVKDTSLLRDTKIL